MRRKILRYANFVILGVLFALGVKSAAAASQVAVSQGYRVSEQAPAAALVALDYSAADTVKLASTDSANDLVGVVVAAGESLLSESSANSQVQVATSGSAVALVSDINGTVKTGDRITASPIKGVGMRDTDSARVLGVAQSSLADAKDTQTVEVKTNDGSTKSVKIGRVNVLIGLTYYTSPGGTSTTFLPAVFQQLSNTVAGKQVSPLRVILSFILLLIAVLISISLVYSAVRSSIISIGRNPLSQPAVRRSLLQVFAFVLAVLLVTLISVYLILSR